MKNRFISGLVALTLVMSPTIVFAQKYDRQTVEDKSSTRAENQLFEFSPVNGATNVRPDQTVFIKMGTGNKDLREHPKKEKINAIFWDGKNIVKATHVSFDPTKSELTVTHPNLNRYTQYAVLVGYDDENNFRSLQSKDRPSEDQKEDQKFSDVVIAFDPASNTVRLLGHGTVTLKLEKDEKKALSPGDFVTVHMEHKYAEIDNRKEHVLSSLFKTGSAIGEATHLTAQVEQPKVRVTDGGKLHVTVTDDYGLPATNATVAATSDSPDLQTSPIVVTNGKGTIELINHKKEIVALSVLSQDNVYHDPVDTQKIQASEQFIAGPPDHLTVHADSPLTVGNSEQVTGLIFDKYNNTVEDDTVVIATPSAGSVDVQQENTRNGAFDFGFSAPTRVQEVVITAKSGDAAGTATVRLQADQPANVELKSGAATMTAGKSENITVLVTDQYGNPVPNTPVALSASGSGKIQASGTTDENGQVSVPFGDTKAETVTIEAAAANGVKGTTQIPVQADKAAALTLKTDLNTIKADGQSAANVTVTVTDQYGNSVPNTPVALSSTSQAKFPATVTTDANGQATFAVTDGTPETISLAAQTENGVKGEIQITAEPVAQPITADYKVLLKATKNPDGSIILVGTVTDPQGKLATGVSVPVQVTGGSPANQSVTAENGSFTLAITPDSSTSPVTVAVPDAGNHPEIGIDPLIYGNQPWTDTGIDVKAGQTIRVVSTGPWVDKLYAQVNGVPVLIGADGTFVAGSAGRLYLGTNGSTYVGVVDSIIYMTGSQEYPDVLPTLDLVTDKTSLPADGKSAAVISGMLMEGPNKPVVGAEITLSLSEANGSLADTTLVTDAQGRFSTIYTAGSTAGTVRVQGSVFNLIQSVSIQLTQSQSQAQPVVAEKQISVNSSTALVDTGVLAQPGEIIEITSANGGQFQVNWFLPGWGFWGNTVTATGSTKFVAGRTWQVYLKNLSGKADSMNVRVLKSQTQPILTMAQQKSPVLVNQDGWVDHPITATVMQDGLPVVNVPLAYTVNTLNGGSFAIATKPVQSGVYTNALGQATNQYRSGSYAGDVTITAFWPETTSSIGVSGTLTIPVVASGTVETTLNVGPAFTNSEISAQAGDIVEILSSSGDQLQVGTYLFGWGFLPNYINFTGNTKFVAGRGPSYFGIRNLSGHTETVTVKITRPESVTVETTMVPERTTMLANKDGLVDNHITTTVISNGLPVVNAALTYSLSSPNNGSFVNSYQYTDQNGQAINIFNSGTTTGDVSLQVSSYANTFPAVNASAKVTVLPYGTIDTTANIGANFSATGMMAKAGDIVEILSSSGDQLQVGTYLFGWGFLPNYVNFTGNTKFVAGRDVEIRVRNLAGHNESIVIKVTKPQVVSASISLQPSITTLTANGTSTSLIQGQVTDANGNPVVNTYVNLSLTGGGRLSSNMIYTDANGKFVVTYTSGTTTGTVQINASAPPLNTSASAQITLQ